MLADSGADDSFMDKRLTRQVGLPLVELAETKSVLDLGGRMIAHTTHLTDMLTLIVSANHCEQIQLYLIPASFISVIDYRGLNALTIRNRYPLLLLDAAFASLQRARMFTKLDLRSAYRLVHIHQGDEWKTAFNTLLGHFEYLVMPFGLTNAPAVFQALLYSGTCLTHCCWFTLTIFGFFSETEKEHIQHVTLVLRRLLENCLFVKAEKCEFHVSSIPFLGFIVEQGNLSPDPTKIKAVM